MQVEIKACHALPCEDNVFNINGIEACRDYFGSMEDTDPYMAEPYGCGCMEFIKSTNVEDKNTAMEKYNITEEEYYKIQDMLTEIFYVGSCGWCI